MARPWLGELDGRAVFGGALRLAVASAQGAAGLSSVPVAPPGRQSSPHFAPARRGARRFFLAIFEAGG